MTEPEFTIDTLKSGSYARSFFGTREQIANVERIIDSAPYENRPEYRVAPTMDGRVALLIVQESPAETCRNHGHLFEYEIRPGAPIRGICERCGFTQESQP